MTTRAGDSTTQSRSLVGRGTIATVARAIDSVPELERAAHVQQREHVEHAVPVVAVGDGRRPQLVDEGFARRRGQAESQEGVARLLGHAAAAVSYTHLTLP